MAPRREQRHQKTDFSEEEVATSTKTHEEVKAILESGDKEKVKALSDAETTLYHINYLRQGMGLNLLSYRPNSCMVCDRSYIAQMIGKKKVNFLCRYCAARGE